MKQSSERQPFSQDSVTPVKTASIKTLHSDPDNPRQISGRALGGLQTAIQTFGDLSGIVFNRRSECLVAGHQRLKALRLAGAKEWVIESETAGYIVHPATGARFGIRIVDWDEVTERAANLVANNPMIQGEYTDEAIGQIHGLAGVLPEFDELALADLASKLEQELRKAEKELKEDLDAAEDESGAVTEDFLVVVECRSEDHQREMIERLLAEGLKCRALI